MMNLLEHAAEHNTFVNSTSVSSSHGLSGLICSHSQLPFCIFSLCLEFQSLVYELITVIM
jgi:hypothetical protein